MSTHRIVAPVDFLFLPTPAAALLISAVVLMASTASVGAASWLVARSLPARVQSRVDELDAAISTIEQTAIELRHQWATTLEQLEVFEAAIEKKRRSAAAAASRAEKAQEQNGEIQQPQLALSPEDQLIAIRRQIYGSR